jgi:hypothetical protein
LAAADSTSGVADRTVICDAFEALMGIRKVPILAPDSRIRQQPQ